MLELNSTKYTKPFMIIFIEANNPDDACSFLIREIMEEVMKHDISINNRILCRKIKKHIRIERIQSL